MHQLVITNAPWAYIQDLHLGGGQRGCPGRQAEYGHVDRDGFYYVGIGEGYRDGEIIASRDIRYGGFYSEKMFLWGLDDNRESIPLWRIIDFLKDIKFCADARRWDFVNVWRGMTATAPPSTSR